ncbi:hypothetical protein [Frankia sp. Cr1]|uniref:hypothetical protein n=1 Tax=Frankia sp. Cr1 TaxID=3073931 RepID=UPI002AD2F538|nr:hypothetical protein [Frankia sp. Cr1]
MAYGWEELIVLMQRRTLLGVSGVALAAVIQEWLIADPARIGAALSGRRIDNTIITDLGSRLDALRRMDDALGGNAIYGVASEELKLVIRLLKHSSYNEGHGAALHASAAELARLTGFAAFDSGRHEAAQRYWALGLRAAHEAGQPALGANIIRNMAEQATWYGNPVHAVGMLRAARAGARGTMTATEAAANAGALAQAHGRAGNRGAAHAAIDEAYGLIEQRRPAEDPAYVYWIGPSVIAFWASEALLSSGNPAAAIPHFEQVIASVDASLPRDQVEYLARFGIAHTRAGNPEAGLELGREVVDQAARLSSQLARHDLQVLQQELTATGHPGTGELADYARATLPPAATTIP